MKVIRMAIATMVLSGALAAQQQPATPQANPVAGAFKGRILGAHRNIAQAFDSFPESKFGYKPTPAQLTFGYIAQHIAEDDYLFCNAFGAMKATIPADESSTPDSVKATWPKEKLVAQLKASFAFCAQALGQITDATLADQVTFTYMGNTRNTTRVNMVLGHALDLADHYSQIANYMRLNDMLPPSALPRRPSK
ncbi:MAG: DinB family protein [Gemmatimonadaceae bacterium]